MMKICGVGHALGVCPERRVSSAGVCKAGKSTGRLPRGPQETADQAIEGARAAFADGVVKQRIEFLPPLTGATDLDDWPGGIRQMFAAILPMVERFLVGVKFQDGLQCKLQPQMIDEGDAVALWTGEHIKAVLFPTADSLLKVKTLAPNDAKLFVLINPQWMEGQVISDFGFGRRKQEIESFLEDFQYTYFLKPYRIQGYDIRCYPSDWSIIVTDEKGEDTCICEDKEKPTYQRIEQVLSDSGWGGGTVLERLKKEFDFNIKSLKQP